MYVISYWLESWLIRFSLQSSKLFFKTIYTKFYLGLDGSTLVEATKLSIKGWRNCPLSLVNFIGLTLLIIFPTPNELVRVNSSGDLKKVYKISDSLKKGFFNKPIRYSSKGFIFDWRTSKPLPVNKFAFGGKCKSSKVPWNSVNLDSKV